VLATGARWRHMGVPGEQEYRNKGVTYCPHCDGPLFKGKRVAVIGGGNSGDEAAIDLAGVTAHVTLLEFDPQLRADEVLQRKLRSLPNVDVWDLQRAKRLVPADAEGGYVTVELESGATMRARSVVLSTGARWRQTGVPGEAEYRNKGVTYCPHCDGPLFKGKRVAVIGGGNSGVEAAIDLAGVVSHVTLIEFDDRLRADEVLQRKLRSLPNVDVVVSGRTTEMLGDGEALTGLAYEDRTTGDIEQIDIEGVFVQIGLLPNTEWLAGSVELSDRGEVVVDERAQTTVPGVFAAGDCTTVPYKQIVIAMGQGSTAALSAFDHLIRTSAPAAVDHAADEDEPEAA